MNSDNKLFKLCYNLLNKYDNVWMKRKRKLDTKTIFEYLVNGAITNIGISTYVNVQQQFSHIALIKQDRNYAKRVFQILIRYCTKKISFKSFICY